MTDRDVSSWLIWGIYLFGIAFMLTAAIDLFTTVWPLRPTEITWRYGFLGLAAGYLQTPTLGLLLIAGGAIWARNGTLLRAAGIAALAFALALLIAMGVFGLDVLQVRQLRPEEMRSTVLYGGIFQEIKYFVATCVLVLIGQGCLKTAKSSASAWSRKAPGIVSTAAPKRPVTREPHHKATQAEPASPAEAAPSTEPDAERSDDDGHASDGVSGADEDEPGDRS